MTSRNSVYIYSRKLLQTQFAFFVAFSEVKRNDKGTVEIKLIDRLRALEQLAQVAESSGEDLEQFLKALQGEDGGA